MRLISSSSASISALRRSSFDFGSAERIFFRAFSTESLVVSAKVILPKPVKNIHGCGPGRSFDLNQCPARETVVLRSFITGNASSIRWLLARFTEHPPPLWRAGGMKCLTVVLAAMLLLARTEASHALIRITNDRGGQIGRY